MQIKFLENTINLKSFCNVFTMRCSYTMKLVSRKATLRKKVLFVVPRNRIISSSFKTELKSDYCDCDCDWHLNLKKTNYIQIQLLVKNCLSNASKLIDVKRFFIIRRMSENFLYILSQFCKAFKAVQTF